MSDHIEKDCPECGQRLRFPKKIGGMLMACPSCGKKFYSDFKVGNTGETSGHGVYNQIFEMPYTLVERLVRYISDLMKR